MVRTTEFGTGVDTSVLVCLLTGRPEGLAIAAREFLAEMETARAPVCVSNLVVAEAYFACQYHYGIPKGDVLGGLYELLVQPTFEVHEDLLQLLSQPELETAKPGFLDHLIHAEYARLGLPLVSFEKAAAHLPNTIVLPPAG